MTVDITEDMPYDLAATVEDTSFSLSSTGYDLSIDNIPFVLSVSNQNPYRRETAQYRKDQFDNSTEPGEQSLTGWWLRSQTSFHNGAGLSYYEPGTDYQHVSHRYQDSRGIDVWTTGQFTLLNQVFHSYTGDNGIVAVAGESAGGVDYIVSGDSAGALKKLTLNEDLPATVSSYTLAADHTSANPFKAITSDGTRYFAVCNLAIHVGNIDGSGSDVVIARHSTGGIHSIKYTKGYLMFGEAESLYHIPLTNPLTTTGHSTSGSTLPTSGTDIKKHSNPNFVWTAIEGGNRVIYAAGYAGADSEIWAVPFDDTTLVPSPAAAVQVAQLPYGEIVQSLCYYLGFLAVGTNKGIRIAQVSETGGIVLGPILVDTAYPVTGFVANDKFIWASTTVKDEELTNACLIRIDLSTQFDDGTFAYAYDLQYESDENSYGKGALYAQDRLHLITNEGSTAGEIQTEKLSAKRTTGWLQTGKIRYGMVEPKYFKYINVTCETGTNDSVTIAVINQNGNELNLTTVTEGLSNRDILLENLYGKQEQIAFKFTLNNEGGDTDAPIFYAYQVKATPGARRQRMFQYPVSCFDVEMDRFGSVFGSENRAIETIQRLEAIEETGRFVNVVDYRTNEKYQGVIEEVRFVNESSPDKNESGFGGLLIITVRKM